MAKDSRQFTAFTVPGRGLYQWKVMPFILHSASATFQLALDSVIGGDMEPFALAYLDDIIVIGATEEQHLANLGERWLWSANLKVNPKKCAFFRRRLVYLGHVISAEGVQTDPEKVTAITNLKSPTCLKELRQWLGMASWYRRFVPNFATMVQPMTALLKKGRKWAWGPAQQNALEEVKGRFTTAPVLGCPDFDKTFVLQTDASDVGLEQSCRKISRARRESSRTPAVDSQPRRAITRQRKKSVWPSYGLLGKCGATWKGIGSKW